MFYYFYHLTAFKNKIHSSELTGQAQPYNFYEHLVTGNKRIILFYKQQKILCTSIYCILCRSQCTAICRFLQNCMFKTCIKQEHTHSYIMVDNQNQNNTFSIRRYCLVTYCTICNHFCLWQDSNITRYHHGNRVLQLHI